ncbi:aminotransferase class IV [Maribellus maritimus]|uniref:aminotransferase class IV n=1 Tax=Maribellus maritimus TaxID=2870838 RepID=UPI001EEBACE8|nr:aminotransferase class IV [Maribellus maritimus]MCG6186454.1 aminotransferase class IV [Maribellus maritimus]
MDRFLIYNGKIVEKGEPDLFLFFTDDTLKITRKIWYGFGGIPLFNENIDLLVKQIDMLQLPVPASLKDKRELFRITKRMLNKNRLYRSGFVFFQLLWNKNGFNFLVTSQPSSTFEFPLSPRGVLLNHSGIKKYSANKFNRFPFFNESTWKAALAQNRGTFFQNTILFNEKKSICECVAANIFLFKKSELITPGLSAGSFEDTLRQIVIDIAKDLGFKVSESDEITPEDISHVDELFIASEEAGIQWVLGVENKRFVHEHSVTIHEKLNTLLREKVKN